jgi:hypothetical protein
MCETDVTAMEWTWQHAFVCRGVAFAFGVSVRWTSLQRGATTELITKPQTLSSVAPNKALSCNRSFTLHATKLCLNYSCTKLQLFKRLYLVESDVYWNVHHCDNWRLKKQTRCHLLFFVLLIGSTCFGHYYAHHQELSSWCCLPHWSFHSVKMELALK